MFSNQDKAKAFRKWAVGVLKEVETTGSYNRQVNTLGLDAEVVIMDRIRTEAMPMFEQMVTRLCKETISEMDQKIRTKLFAPTLVPPVEQGYLPGMAPAQYGSFSSETTVSDEQVKAALETIRKNYFRRAKYDDLYTLARAFQVLVAKYKTVKEVARVLNLSRRNINDYTRILNLEPEIIEMIKNRQIDQTQAIKQIVKHRRAEDRLATARRLMMKVSA